MRLFVLTAIGLLLAPAAALRVFTSLPDPAAHPLYARHTTKPPPLSLYAANKTTLAPGFAAIRGLNSYAPQTWAPLLDLYTNATDAGGLGLANIVWPGYGIVFSPNWIALAQTLAARGLPAVDLGGFVPGGVQDYNVSDAANYTAGAAIMGDSLLGFDMGEQDVRYLWGYAQRSTTLLAPSQRGAFRAAFADFSTNIEQKLAGRLMALSSSVYAVHHWLKSGLYTGAGSETSQSNGNAQLLYAFVRGAAKQYGALWYGQVSIFNAFGVKSYDAASPSPNCTHQGSASPTCGTSLNLMKRLLYTQLAYNPAYFAFEGGLLFTANNSLTPIGLLQQQAKAHFAAAAAAAASAGAASPLGVHAATIAVLLDYEGGWARPCDARPQRYTGATWGGLPWDAADALADAVLDELLPGYRAGTLLRNETGTLAPTPYGDAADVLLSDALLEVLGRYDTVVLAHRLRSGARGDVRARLEAFVAGGGRLLATADSVADLGGLGGVGVGDCAGAPAGTAFALADGSGGSNVTEPLAFTLCALALPPGAEVLASVAGASGAPAAARVALGNGTLVVLAPGGYGMAPQNASAPYACAVDQADSRQAQPFAMVALVRHFLQAALNASAQFDLGGALSWVPARVARGEYLLTVTNPSLAQLPLRVAARAGAGAIASVQALPLPQGEKGALGYVPHGYENVDLGVTTNSTLAGGDTVVLRVVLSGDGAGEVSAGGAGAAAGAAGLAALPPQRQRLLRLGADTLVSLRRAVSARPAFEAAYSGVLIDYSYVWERSEEALAAEGAWLALRNCSVAVDFTAGLTLFPGLRLVNDMGGYYEASMGVVQGVLDKMALLRARHAVLALHGVSEMAPANFSADPRAQAAASVAATLRSLVAYGAARGVALHLRRSSRNDDLAGAGLAAQAAFAAAAGARLAPALAYAANSGDSAGAAAGAFASGAAQLLLLSSAWSAYEGHASESATLAAGGSGGGGGGAGADQCAWLRTVHAQVVSAGGVVVMDAGYASQEEEMADVRALDACLLGVGV